MYQWMLPVLTSNRTGISRRCKCRHDCQPLQVHDVRITKTKIVPFRLPTPLAQPSPSHRSDVIQSIELTILAGLLLPVPFHNKHARTSLRIYGKSVSSFLRRSVRPSVFFQSIFFLLSDGDSISSMHKLVYNNNIYSNERTHRIQALRALTRSTWHHPLFPPAISLPPKYKHAYHCDNRTRRDGWVATWGLLRNPFATYNPQSAYFQLY